MLFGLLLLRASVLRWKFPAVFSHAEGFFLQTNEPFKLKVGVAGVAQFSALWRAVAAM